LFVRSRTCRSERLGAVALAVERGFQLAFEIDVVGVKEEATVFFEVQGAQAFGQRVEVSLGRQDRFECHRDS
jgi:hypothetical protein